MELIPKVLLVVCMILLLYYYLITIWQSKTLTKVQKNKRPLDEYSSEKNSRHYQDVNTQSDCEPNNYKKFLEAKSRSTPNGEATGLDAGEAFYLMRNSKNPNIFVDDDGKIHYR